MVALCGFALPFGLSLFGIEFQGKKMDDLVGESLMLCGVCTGDEVDVGCSILVSSTERGCVSFGSCDDIAAAVAAAAAAAAADIAEGDKIRPIVLTGVKRLCCKDN